MTDRSARPKPAVAAKVMVTGASLTSALAMTAAMGSASSKEIEPLLEPTATPIDLETTADLVIDFVSLPPKTLAGLASTPPVVGEVRPPASVQSTFPPVGPTGSVSTAPTEVAAVSRPAETPTAPPAPVAESVPIADPVTVPEPAPTPVIVQIPAPAPAPSASTSKSR